MNNKLDIWSQMDEWSASGTPFVFLLDFEIQKPLLYKADAVPDSIRFSINDETVMPSLDKAFHLESFPLSLSKYGSKFNKVQESIYRGDTFLLNLSAKTPIISNYTLSEIYDHSRAKFKIEYKDNFVCFSPERFIKIEDGLISTYPMKGTINADIPNAAKLLTSDKKERAEHATTVDLLRNDLSMVARDVRLKRYAYLDRIETNDGAILQMSSEIVGRLKNGELKLGTILSKILPAGSICGAPKPKTLEVIRKAEGEDRGYYTGIFGYFDGQCFDSAVMIRFIEKQENNKMYFRSGGGITHLSNLESEYQELLNKIYVPIHRNHTNQKWEDSTSQIPQPTVQ